MMEVIRPPPPVHLETRVAAPIPPEPARLQGFFGLLVRRTPGPIRWEPWRLRLGPLTLLRFGPPAPTAQGWRWPIDGGLLARRPGGWIEVGWGEGALVCTVHGYRPRLPRPLYALGQRPVHDLLTRLALLDLRGRTPPPGPPAEPVLRLLTAALDLGLCAGLTRLLPRRRLFAFVALASLYHLGFWGAAGRTPAGWLTGQHLVSVDGSRVGTTQALIRLLALPLAVGRLRALHDQAAATEVVRVGASRRGAVRGGGQAAAARRPVPPRPSHGSPLRGDALGVASQPSGSTNPRREQRRNPWS